MRALLQRVSSASVSSGGKLLGSIGPGLVVLLGITHSDTEELAAKLADKAARLRIFNDADGRMNLSVADVGGAFLVVSQFTLYADARSGNRPGYSDAARPETALPLYRHFTGHLADLGFAVETGEFGADMQVEIHNDGPVTVLLDTDEL